MATKNTPIWPGYLPDARDTDSHYWRLEDFEPYAYNVRCVSCGKYQTVETLAYLRMSNPGCDSNPATSEVE